MRSRRILICHLVAWFSCLALPISVLAQTLDADAAEQLVRQTWYEGLPLDQAERIGAAGTARLIALLEDAEERGHHANILMALAASGQASAYDAIAAWATLPRTGEVDRATFRAWQTLPHALGELARRDPRALDLLAEQLDIAPQAWRFRHHDATRIRRLIRRAAASGLARSGRPEAGRMLRRAEREAAGDPSFRQHLRDCRAEHRKQRGQRR